MDDALIDRFAQLAVGFGANVQPGQVVTVSTDLGREQLARAVAAQAYAAGARYVEVTYADPFVRRARIEHGSDEAIGFAPSWQMDRVRQMGEQHVAQITIHGGIDPRATEGLDPDRLGRDQPPTRQEYLKLVTGRLINWTIVAMPTVEWAVQVHPDLPPERALERLWEQVVHVCRLDEADPVGAWNARMNRLLEVAERLTERRFTAVGFRGPGTDLTVGLFESSRWLAATFETADGIRHHPNLPSEEIFTTPNPERVDGEVTSTMPLEIEGTIVRGLRVRFEGGRAVSIDADEGADILRARAERDEGAARLGEVALVDGEGRIGPLGTTFYNTLFDENAASHIALGMGYGFAVEDEAERERVNASSIHIDFMIGSPDMEVDGITADGHRVALLRAGGWQV
jgi:aminopeptidase